MSAETFAQRVALLESNLPNMYSVEDDATIYAILQALREQQAALAAVAEGVDNYSVDLLKRNGMLITNGLAEAQNEARAVLAKWRIE